MSTYVDFGEAHVEVVEGYAGEEPGEEGFVLEVVVVYEIEVLDLDA